MIESDFNSYLGCMFVLGFSFVYVMNCLGKKNCIENPLERHLALKIIGGVLLAIGLVYVVLGYSYWSIVEHPLQSLPQPISKNMHVREPYATLHIGYRTASQGMVISLFYGAIQFIALGVYLMSFRKSGTNWWQKTLKVLAYFTMFLLLPAVIDFHYFDLFEFITPTIMLVLITLCLINWKGIIKHGIKYDNASIVKPIGVGEKDPEERELSSIDVEL